MEKEQIEECNVHGGFSFERPRDAPKHSEGSDKLAEMPGGFCVLELG